MAHVLLRMALVSFKYWNDCVDPDDMEAMWMEPDVRQEWLDAGETPGSKVHLSRDPDGHPYLTRTEMRAVAGIIVRRHFISKISSDMLCAIAELESDRQPLAERYNKKSNESKLGIMQISQKTAEWLSRDLDFRYYQVDDPNLLHKPFVNIYFGAAYLKWLSNFDDEERTEEFMVRAYKGGTKKPMHKSTMMYWQKYLAVKGSLPSRKTFSSIPLTASYSCDVPKGPTNTTWDSRTSAADMEALWNNPLICKEWMKSGEKRGNARFSHDVNKNPYLSRVEIRVVADIILAKHFRNTELKPTHLCAISELVSFRFVNGFGHHTGLMGIDYPTARWLYHDMGYKGYTVESVEDLTKPFVSVYFGAAYMCWLSKYEGRKRSLEFVIQAYLAGPQNVNDQGTGPHWHKFEETLARYAAPIRKPSNSYMCIIM